MHQGVKRAPCFELGILGRGIGCSLPLPFSRTGRLPSWAAQPRDEMATVERELAGPVFIDDGCLFEDPVRFVMLDLLA